MDILIANLVFCGIGYVGGRGLRNGVLLSIFSLFIRAWAGQLENI